MLHNVPRTENTVLDSWKLYAEQKGSKYVMCRPTIIKKLSRTSREQEVETETKIPIIRRYGRTVITSLSYMYKYK